MPVPSASSSRSLARRIASGSMVLAVGVGLASCAADPVTDAYLEGTNQGYISSDFRWEEIAEADRGEPVPWAGVTEAGDALSSDDTAGKVTVVNFWYAACGPCRAEAGDLQSVWEQYEGDDVQFVGVNTYDQPDTALSFADEYGITYPSIIDVNDGAVKLAFAGKIPIRATPTTLVLDRQGRVSAVIIGQLEGASVLATLVGDAVKEAA